MKLQLYILCCLIFTAQCVRAQDSLVFIRLDQEGFYPKAPKIAVLAGILNKSSSTWSEKVLFFVIRENSSDTVFRGKLSTVRFSFNSSLQTRIADFSSLNKTGIFRVETAGFHSYPFRIEEKVHHPSAVASLKAFYYQRASMPLGATYAGKWSRAAGHPDDSVIIHPSAASDNREAGSVISTPGGWYRDTSIGL
jgi:endoglucanase